MLRNSDGAGFAVKRAGSKDIYYEKGLMKYPDLLAAFRNLSQINPADEFVFHARIRSAGERNQRMTHPFIISSDSGEVDGVINNKLSNVTNKNILFHNGTFSEFIGKNDRLSDTFNFAHAFMSKFSPNLQNRQLKKWQKSFINYTRYQKLAFMFGGSIKEELELRGTFVADNGMFYSNGGYKSYSNYERETESYMCG